MKQYILHTLDGDFRFSSSLELGVLKDILYPLKKGTSLERVDNASLEDVIKYLIKS